MNGDGSRFAVEFPSTRDIETFARDIDGAAERAVAVVIVYRTPVGARQHQQRTVVGIHVVEQDADGQHVLVGVRIERPVLVPLHGRAVVGGLHVDLAAGTQADVLADQWFKRGHDAPVGGEFPVEGIGQVGLFDPPDPGRVRGVRRFQVEDVGVVFDALGAGDDLVGDPAQVGQSVVQHVLNQHIAVLAVLGDLGLGQRLHHGQLSHDDRH